MAGAHVARYTASGPSPPYPTNRHTGQHLLPILRTHFGRRHAIRCRSTRPRSWASSARPPVTTIDLPVNPPPADLHLTAGSVAINAADPAVNLCPGGQAARDADGFLREAVDRGALEFFSQPPDPAGASFSCSGD